jgi:hypothetical protein
VAIPRFLYPNYARAANTAVNASSELSTHPAYWTKDQLRSKPWRSRPGHTFVAGFNDELHYSTADGPRIAHIVPGNYTTGALAAAAVQTALNAGGYNPRTALTGMTGWWRGDATVIDAAGLAQTALDISGNGRNLVQPSSASRPLWGASTVIDGRPGWYFDGTAGLALTSSTPSTTMSTFLGANGVGTIIIVFRLDSDAAANDSLWFAGSGAQFAWFMWTSGNNFDAQAFDTANRIATKASTAGVSTLQHGWWEYDQTNLQAYASDADTAAATNTAMTGALHANIMSSFFTIGSVGGSPLKGYVMEAMIYNRALAEFERRGITNYLRQRYPTLTDSTTAAGWTVTLGASYAASKFTISRTGGAGNISLLTNSALPAENKAAAGYLDLGYTTAADKTGTTTYTAENTSYQSRHWLQIDIGSSPSIMAAAVLDHNAGAGATFTIEGNSMNSWVSPAFSQALTGDATIRLAFFSAQALRHWRLVVNDVSNSVGYAEIPVWSVSPWVAPTYCHSQNFQKVLEELSQIGYGTHGSHFADERPQRWVWSTFWEDMPEADRILFETLALAVKVGQTLFVSWDPVVTPTDTWYVFRREPVSWSMTVATPLWNIPVQFAEAID